MIRSLGVRCSHYSDPENGGILLEWKKADQNVGDGRSRFRSLYNGNDRVTSQGRCSAIPFLTFDLILIGNAPAP